MPTTITKRQHDTTSRVFRVDEIQPNPFRDIKRYPLDEKKIKAFRESFRATGFWHTLPARIRKDGKPEIVFGHHRVEALRQEFGGNFEVRLTIEEISAELMLKRLFWENREEWNTNALVDLASIRMVVEAYADGVPLPPPKSKSPKAKLRYAPSFRQGQGDVACAHRQHPYTAATVANFLGSDHTKVESTLAALELIERKVVDEDLYDGLTRTQASVLTTGVRKVVSAADAKAKEYEKKADTARKQAAEAEPGKERAGQEKLAESALHAANAVRKGVQEEVDCVARYASSAFQDGAATRAVSAQLKKLHKPPPPPGSHDDDKEPADGIAEYLDHLPECIAEVRQVRAHAERFSPEQIENALNGSGALQQELAAHDTDLIAVARKREQRGGVRIERSGKEKQHKARRFGVTKRRRRRAKAHV